MLALLRGRGESIRAVTFSADGSMLAAGDVTGGIQIWNVTSAGEVASFAGHSTRIRALAFSPNGQLLASGCVDGGVHVWDLTTLERVATLRESTDRVRALQFSPDGTLLAYGDEVRLWDVRTRRDVSTLGTPDEHARTLRFSRDGSLLAWITGEDTIRVWDLVAGSEVARRSAGTHAARTIAFDSTGSLVASGATDGTIRIWDLRSDVLRATLRASSNWVVVVEFVGADCETLIAGTADGTVRLWKVDDGAPPGRPLLAGRTAEVIATRLVPDQPLVAAAGENGTLRIWDVRTAAQVRTGSGEQAWIYGMVLTDDATLLAAGGEDGLVRIYELTPGRAGDGQTNLDTPARRLNTRRSPVRAVAFSPDTTLLAVGHPDGTVGLWNPWSGQPTATLRADGLRVLSVAFSPDGERLAAGTDAGTVHVWDAVPASGPSARQPNSTASRRLVGHTDWVHTVVFSPDGALLASASGSGSVRSGTPPPARCAAGSWATAAGPGPSRSRQTAGGSRRAARTASSACGTAKPAKSWPGWPGTQRRSGRWRSPRRATCWCPAAPTARPGCGRSRTAAGSWPPCSGCPVAAGRRFSPTARTRPRRSLTPRDAGRSGGRSGCAASTRTS